MQTGVAAPEGSVRGQRAAGVRILVAFATKHGSTRDVAEAVAHTLRGEGLSVDVQPAGAVTEVDSYDAVVMGGALYMGRWHADARRFLAHHRKALAARPVAVFAMGPLTMEEKDVEGARRQLERALGKAREVDPVAIAIFGGVVDPSVLRFPFNRMPASDARDWQAIEDWSREIAIALVPERL